MKYSTKMSKRQKNQYQILIGENSFFAEKIALFVTQMFVTNCASREISPLNKEIGLSNNNP